MTLLNRDAILNAQDLKTRDVPVPEWGGTVRVSMLTGTARDDMSKRMADAEKAGEPANWRALLVAAAVVDENGLPVFTPDDVKALGAKSSVALQRVFDVANALNAITPAAVEAAAGN